MNDNARKGFIIGAIVIILIILIIVAVMIIKNKNNVTANSLNTSIYYIDDNVFNVEEEPDPNPVNEEIVNN